jgi:hypothetical protein
MSQSRCCTPAITRSPRAYHSRSRSMIRDTRSVPPVLIAALLSAACAPAVTVAPPAPCSAATGGGIRSDHRRGHVSDRTLRAERQRDRGRVLARVPGVAVRDFRYDYNADGTLARVEWLTRAADLVSDSVLARTVVTFANDTAYVETGIGATPRGPSGFRRRRPISRSSAGWPTRCSSTRRSARRRESATAQ